MNCYVCGKEFEPVPSQVSGRSAKRCKPCRRAYLAKRAESRRAQGLKTGGGQMPTEYKAAWQRRKMADPSYRAKKSRQVRDSQKRHPDHTKARRLVRTALERGEMVRHPCQVCGSQKVEAHHDDYSRPLDVRWLCRRHHADADRRTT